MKAALAAVVFLVAAGAARASDVYINLAGKTGETRLVLAMPAFTLEHADKPEEGVLAAQIQEVVREDLLFSRYFILEEQGRPLTGWLLTAKVSQEAPKVAVSVLLKNLDSGESVFERYYRQDSAYLRSTSHRIANDVIMAITGKTGISHTQIVFSNNQTGSKEIYMMDYDGANLRQLTADKSINILPRFAPGRKQIAYTSYKAGNPDLFLLDLEKKKTRVLSNEQGLNIAGGFSPDGTQLLMTLSLQKNPNLFVKNLADNSVSRLTQHFGVDTSPTFSPDGEQVAFVTDRSGNPQIYILNMTTQKTKRLTHTMNWCDSPSWSPTGEWIAFAGRVNIKDKIDIFLVDVTGNQIRQLTHGEGSNENPSWSPDGRFIAFTSTRNKRPELFIMDADGSAPSRLAEIPGSTFTPHWSN